MSKRISKKNCRSLAVCYNAFHTEKEDGRPSPVWAAALLDAQRACGVVLLDEKHLKRYIPEGWR